MNTELAEDDLSEFEKERFAFCISYIDEHLQSSFNTANCLKEIHDNRYYRKTHDSFPAFTKERWNIGKSQAYRIIGPREDRKLVENRSQASHGGDVCDPDCQDSPIVYKSSENGEIDPPPVGAPILEAKVPAVPGPVGTHGDIVKYCLQLLEHGGFLAWKSHTATVELKHGGWLRTGRPGLPDVCAIIPPDGRLLLLECKTEKDEVRPHQDQFMTVAGQQGAFCCVVRDPEELMYVIGRLKETPDLRPEDL